MQTLLLSFSPYVLQPAPWLRAPTHQLAPLRPFRYRRYPLETKPPDSISNGFTSSTFANIPLDVFLTILDELDLGDRFFFSQTCRTVRGLTRKDWSSAIAGKDPQQRRRRTDFYATIAYRLPKQWVCGACSKLHVLPRRQQTYVARDLHCRRSDDLPRAPSGMTHAYVQMALKLCRPKIRSAFPGEARKMLLSDIFYRKWAKVLDGRLLVHAKWRIYVDSVYTTNRVCPHFHFEFSSAKPVYGEEQTNSRKQYRYVVESAWRTKRQEFRGACWCCPTDYSAYNDGTSTLVQVWFDFGAYSSPEDITWKAHVDRDSILYHKPGTIREEWERHDGVGVEDNTASASSFTGVGKSYPCERGDEVDDFPTAMMSHSFTDEW